MRTNQEVLPHHETAAALWSLGGAGYERVSFGISDALAHAAQRLNAQPGELVLDVATGTGWTARNVAATGAKVTAVDIATGLLDAARKFSGHVHPPIDFRIADAEALPFSDKTFDRVISTFGVMFAANHDKAASELARVCCPGGRLVLSTWVPDGSVADLFGIIGKYSNHPRPDPSPLMWGDLEHVRALLGDAFELTFERGLNHSYADDAESIWKTFEKGFGPVRDVLDAVDKETAEAFRNELDTYHRKFTTDSGLISIEREYLITIGKRREVK